MAGRGKKLNQVKNNQAAREFAEGKKIDRPKQAFVAEPSMYDVLRGYRGGRWEKVK